MKKCLLVLCLYIVCAIPAKSRETLALDEALKQENVGVFFKQGTTEVPLFKIEGNFKLYGEGELYKRKNFNISVTPNRRYTPTELKKLISDASQKSEMTRVLFDSGWEGNITFDREELKFTDILIEICVQTKFRGWKVGVQTSIVTMWEDGLSKPVPVGEMVLSVITFIK